jgi:hypothetical protein
MTLHFAVSRFISHDSRLRFGNWNHFAADAVKGLRTSGISCQADMAPRPPFFAI